jgi:signal transduction histidine kinase
LRTAVDKAITGIDQTLSIVTALLRIREIEQTRRRDGFGDVGLAQLLREAGDLYEPFAEERRIALEVKTATDFIVRGDRDLLFEAITNLIDNAIKFTPEGGRVEISTARLADEGVVRVSDTGPGVTAGERDLIVQRFYRSDKSRHTRGLGLGLSLVAAIVKLHGFRFNIWPGPGFVAEIAFQPANN